LDLQKTVNVRLNKAKLLLNCGKHNESYLIFKEIPPEEITESNFTDYLSVLVKLEKYAEADEIYKNCPNKQPEITVEYSKLYNEKKLFEKAINILEDFDKNNYFTSDVNLWLISNYNSVGQYTKSIEICRKLIKEGFESYDLYSLKGETEYYLKWYSDSKISLEKALSYAPNDKSVKNLLDIVSGQLGEGYNSIIKGEITAVPVPQEILDKALLSLNGNKEDLSKYNSYFQSYVKGFSFIKNKEIKFTAYRVIKINNMAGVNKYSTIQIPYNPFNEDIFINSIIVKDSQNNVVSKGEPKTYYIIDKQNNEFANYEKEINVPIPNLQPGNIIEITATFKYFNSEKFPFERDSLSRDDYSLFSSVFITGNVEDIIYKSINCSDPVKTKDSLIWTADSPYYWVNEIYASKVEKYLSIAVVSDKNSDWRIVLGEYYSKIKDKFEVEKEIKELSDSLTFGIKNNNDKIIKILSYIQENIVYKAIEFGSRANIPNKGSVILTNKYGDCKDQALLAHLLLKQAGINSFLTLVNLNEIVDENMPSLDQFNHMILYIPELRTKLVDLTNKELTPGIVPYYYKNNNILILDGENYKFSKYDGEVYDKDCSIIIDRIVKADSILAIDETIEIGNYFSTYIRYRYKNINKNDYFNDFQAFFKSYNNNIVLKNCEIENLNELNKNLKLKLSYKIDSEIIHDDSIIINIPAIMEKYFVNPVSILERKTPFELSIPLNIVSKNSVILPEIFAVKLKEESKNSENIKFGKWKRVLKPTGNGFYLEWEAAINAGFYDKSEYSQFYNFNNESLKVLEKNVVLKKK